MDRKEDIIDMICRCGYFCELKFTLHFHRIKHIGYAQEKKYLLISVHKWLKETILPYEIFELWPNVLKVLNQCYAQLRF